jgi:hypothetical protein
LVYSNLFITNCLISHSLTIHFSVLNDLTNKIDEQVICLVDTHVIDDQKPYRDNSSSTTSIVSSITTCSEKLCSTCGKRLHDKETIELAESAKKVSLKYMEYSDKVICINCTQAIYQMHRIEEKNKHMTIALSAIMKTSSYSWKKSSSTHTMNDSFTYLKNNFKYNYLFENDSDYLHMLRKINVSIIKVDSNHTPKKYRTLSSTLEGSSVDNNFEMNEFSDCTLSLPDTHDTFGVIDLNFKNNFIIISPFNISTYDYTKMCYYESQHIKNLKTSSRAGSAGGVVLMDSNSHSLTSCTRKDTTLFVNHKNGCGASIVYDASCGKKKLFNGVYNDIYMRRMDQRQKLNELSKHLFLRRITINEMKNRFISLLIARRFELLDKKNCHPSDILTHIIDTKKEEIDHFKKIGHTTFESILMVWSCSTGQMNNHSALKAHTDGNKSHEVETMTLYGRSNNDCMRNMTIDSDGDGQQGDDGYLLLPLNGIVIKLQCGISNIHCNLTNTIHVPDKSRNTSNWTKVHGPKNFW